MTYSLAAGVTCTRRSTGSGRLPLTNSRWPEFTRRTGGRSEGGRVNEQSNRSTGFPFR